MDSGVPSWAEMLGRVAAVAFDTAQGTVSWRDPDEEHSSQGTVDFWFERPDKYRCEDTDGLVFLSNERETLVRDSDGSIQRMPAGTCAYFDWHPKELLGGPEVVRSLSEVDDFSRPTGPAMPDTVAGRLCWRFVLEPPPHKPAELEVAIDDETGVILDLRSRGIDASTTLTRFEPNVQPARGLFEYDGEVQEDWLRESEDRDRLGEWQQSRSWPVPRHWPDGPEFHLLEAGEDGSFMARLRVGGQRYPVLARWPSGTRDLSGMRDRSRPSEGGHVHSWETEAWDWALGVDQPLTAEQLAAVIDSIPVLEQG